jgi:hypothetical protein
MFDSQVQEQIHANNADYAARAETIRNDENLSPDGRSQALNTAYEQATTKHQELVAKNAASVDGKRDELCKAVIDPGSLSSDQAAFRQSMSIALTAPSLPELAKVARLTGDKALLKAATAAALAKEDWKTLGQLAEHDEALDKYLQCYQAVKRPHPTQRLSDAMKLAGPPRPMG